MRLFILILGLLVGASSLAQATKPLHHIFFIHGIGGNAETFGVMPEATAFHLRMEDPSQDYRSYRFVYKTADQKLDTDDFAVQFGEFIHEKLGSTLGENDKISVIAHSQGGLVATIWYFHSFLQHLEATGNPARAPKPLGGKNTNYFPAYSQHMDAIITIGTPFWGSKLATLLIDDSSSAKIVQKVGKSVIEKMGQRQLEEMALGSRTIINFRKNVLSIPEAVLDQMKKTIRPVNIAGAARLDELFKEKTWGVSFLLRGLKEYGFGGRHFESDVAVSVPSAHFDSIYTIDHSKEYIDGQITPLHSSHTRKSSFAPLTILNTIHASPWPEEVYDMAYVPTKCHADRNCDHPTFKYVLDHMLGKTLPKFGKGISSDELGGFLVSIRINFPKTVEAKNVRVWSTHIVDDQASKEVEVVMANSKEFLSDYDFFHPTQKNVLFRTYTGHLKYTESGVTYGAHLARKNGYPVRLLIQADGFKARYIDTLLQPTYSTYIEVDLEKK